MTQAWKRGFAAAFAVALTLWSFSAVADEPARTQPPPAAPSLFERLGGEPAIAAVVANFVSRGAADPAVNFTRQGTPHAWEATPENVEKLKALLTQFICKATGGPQSYEGRDMKSAHAGMHISNAEFDALAADLKASLDALNVPAKEQDELLAIVGTTRADIVET